MNFEEIDSKYQELRARLAIDLNDLHHNAQYQAELCADAGELNAEASAGLDRAEIEFEEAKALANMEIRKTPESFGIMRITEDAIKSAVSLHPAVKAAGERVIAARETANKTAGLFTAYRHRQSMLELEGSLFRSNYWGDPDRTTRSLTETGGVGQGIAEQKMEMGRVRRRK